MPLYSCLFGLSFGLFGLYIFIFKLTDLLHIKILQISTCILMIFFAIHMMISFFKKKNIPILKLFPEGMHVEQVFIPWKQVDRITFAPYYKYSRKNMLRYCLNIKLKSGRTIKVELSDIRATPYTLRRAFQTYKPVELSSLRAFYFDYLYFWRYMLFFLLLLGPVVLFHHARNQLN